MKITRSDGKYIVDFEGLEIDVSGVDANFGFRGLGFCAEDLFDSDVVSEVWNGVWNFGKKEYSNSAKDEV